MYHKNKFGLYRDLVLRLNCNGLRNNHGQFTDHKKKLTLNMNVNVNKKVKALQRTACSSNDKLESISLFLDNGFRHEGKGSLRLKHYSNFDSATGKHIKLSLYKAQHFKSRVLNV